MKQPSGDRSARRSSPSMLWIAVNHRKEGATSKWAIAKSSSHLSTTSIDRGAFVPPGTYPTGAPARLHGGSRERAAQPSPPAQISVSSSLPRGYDEPEILVSQNPPSCLQITDGEYLIIKPECPAQTFMWERLTGAEYLRASPAPDRSFPKGGVRSCGQFRESRGRRSSCPCSYETSLARPRRRPGLGW